MLVLPKIPAIIIILIIEHVAIAKSFGRQYGYTVVPSQEMLAQGASNFFGTFVGGYACTGSFGASAVLSKAGVRTPLAGLYSAVILVLALYALTAVFFYIPMAALAGLIIHAVLNLPTPPRTILKYWKLGPVEFVIWWAGVLIAIFESLEVSIYVTICLSLALLLVRVAHARGPFLGQTSVHHPLSPPSHTDHDTVACTPGEKSLKGSQSSSSIYNHRLSINSEDLGSASTATPCPATLPRHHDSISDTLSHCTQQRHAYIPLDHSDNSNSSLSISAPYPGVFIYRFPTILCYANQAQHMQRLTQYIKANTRQPPPPKKPADRLWCETATSPASSGTKKDNASEKTHHAEDHLPLLRAVILDCSAIDTLDITSIQGLVDARKILDKHADCEEGCSGRCVQWHFAGVWNPWTRKALVVAGFGVLPRSARKDQAEKGKGGSGGDDVETGDQCHSTQEVETNTHSEGESEDSEGQGDNPVVNRKIRYSNKRYNDLPDKAVCEDMCERAAVLGEDGDGKLVPVRGTDRPFFHLGLAEAVDAAVAFTKCLDVKGKRREEKMEP